MLIVEWHISVLSKHVKIHLLIIIHQPHRSHFPKPCHSIKIAQQRFEKDSSEPKVCTQYTNSPEHNLIEGLQTAPKPDGSLETTSLRTEWIGCQRVSARHRCHKKLPEVYYSCLGESEVFWQHEGGCTMFGPDQLKNIFCVCVTRK